MRLWSMLLPTMLLRTMLLRTMQAVQAIPATRPQRQ
jgi:hypothetical protein